MTTDGRSPKAAAISGGFPLWAARLLAAATAVYSVVLVAATHYPKPEEFLGPNAPSDKLLHFMAYGLLGLLAAATLLAYGRWSRPSAAKLFVGLALAAILDEATQPLFSRAAEPLDWVFDLIGLAIGILLVGAVSSSAWGRGSRSA
jgi:VanZ family protein